MSNAHTSATRHDYELLIEQLAVASLSDPRISDDAVATWLDAQDEPLSAVVDALLERLSPELARAWPHALATILREGCNTRTALRVLTPLLTALRFAAAHEILSAVRAERDRIEDELETLPERYRAGELDAIATVEDR